MRLLSWLFIICLTLLVIVLIIIIIFLFSHLRVHIEANRSGEKDEIRLDIYAMFNIIHYRIHIPSVKLHIAQKNIETETEAGIVQTNGTPANKKKLKFLTPRSKKRSTEVAMVLLHNIKNLHQLLLQVLRHVKVDELIWKSRIGTGDAAETGVLTGIAWSVKSTLIGYITSYIQLFTIPKMDIAPSFHETKLETTFRCVFRFRVIYGVVIGLRLFFRALKNGKKIWRGFQVKASA
ncbi:MAG: DUF2953 domain-containing protein [Bacilli bacterium]